MKRLLLFLLLALTACEPPSGDECPEGQFVSDVGCRLSCLQSDQCGAEAYCSDGLCYACPDSGCPRDCTPDRDADGDGLCETDNCPGMANPTQTDTDTDGLGDACDACPADPGNDADTDGICGDLDTCPELIDDQTDTDTDGVGDACDACPLDPNNDMDGDELCGDVDDCPENADPQQLDADDDGIGDACDPCPGDNANDIDGDGICEAVDGCPGDPTRSEPPCRLVQLPTLFSNAFNDDTEVTVASNAERALVSYLEDDPDDACFLCYSGPRRIIERDGSADELATPEGFSPGRSQALSDGGLWTYDFDSEDYPFWINADDGTIMTGRGSDTWLNDMPWGTPYLLTSVGLFRVLDGEPALMFDTDFSSIYPTLTNYQFVINGIDGARLAILRYDILTTLTPYLDILKEGTGKGAPLPSRWYVGCTESPASMHIYHVTEELEVDIAVPGTFKCDSSVEINTNGDEAYVALSDMSSARWLFRAKSDGTLQTVLSSNGPTFVRAPTVVNGATYIARDDKVIYVPATGAGAVATVPYSHAAVALPSGAILAAWRTDGATGTDPDVVHVTIVDHATITPYTFPAHSPSTYGCQPYITSSGDVWILITGDTDALYKWNGTTGTLEHSSLYVDVAALADGTVLVGGDGTISTLNATRQPLASQPEGATRISSVAASHDASTTLVDDGGYSWFEVSTDGYSWKLASYKDGAIVVSEIEVRDAGAELYADKRGRLWFWDLNDTFGGGTQLVVQLASGVATLEDEYEGDGAPLFFAPDDGSAMALYGSFSADTRFLHEVDGVTTLDTNLESLIELSPTAILFARDSGAFGVCNIESGACTTAPMENPRLLSETGFHDGPCVVARSGNAGPHYLYCEDFVTP